MEFFLFSNEKICHLKFNEFITKSSRRHGDIIEKIAKHKFRR